jgi:hypothetical protein
MRVLSVALMLAALAVSTANAGPRETIIGKNAVFCDDGNRVCLRGTLTYYANPRLLELRCRVQRATGPGLLRIRLVGRNGDGHARRTTLEVRVEGRYSEIVDTKLITDHPDVYHWELDSVGFEPGAPADGN